ncbi:MAG TPA: hypothetical protein VK906_11665 [Egicoccus sp.]|nr:hypothetical protein [Egicoccus sp.]HSK23830.1 hypothetical protein [Egicoccus sp.]
MAGQGALRVLDLGVQDTGGPRAAQWALVLRGANLDEADAAKVIFDAAKPLEAAGIAILDALVAGPRPARGVLAGVEVIGSWRPRSSGTKLRAG